MYRGVFVHLLLEIFVLVLVDMVRANYTQRQTTRVMKSFNFLWPYRRAYVRTSDATGDRLRVGSLPATTASHCAWSRRVSQSAYTARGFSNSGDFLDPAHAHAHRRRHGGEGGGGYLPTRDATTITWSRRHGKEGKRLYICSSRKTLCQGRGGAAKPPALQEQVGAGKHLPPPRAHHPCIDTDTRPRLMTS